VFIPASCPAFHADPEGDERFRKPRIPHTWSRHPELCKPDNLYRVVTAFSIGEGPEWYFRVAPIVNGRTQWDEVSDRLHVIPGLYDYTEGWELRRPAKPQKPKERAVTRIAGALRSDQSFATDQELRKAAEIAIAEEAARRMGG
jgi:hypothetical protein